MDYASKLNVRIKLGDWNDLMSTLSPNILRVIVIHCLPPVPSIILGPLLDIRPSIV